MEVIEFLSRRRGAEIHIENTKKKEKERKKEGRVFF
jgi:hypothetical protein